jgi:molecular chaperone GrpE
MKHHQKKMPDGVADSPPTEAIEVAAVDSPPDIPQPNPTPPPSVPGDGLPPETPGDEAAKYRELAMRAAADLDNFRKRTAREKADALRHANAALLTKLLPLIDNFDLGLEAARGAEGGTALVSGFEMVRHQLGDFLRDAGVEEIEAEGAAFDPNLHEALAGRTDGEVPEGVVLKQLRRGYRLGDRLLRPAGVVVSKGPGEPA